ncbi:spindle assembly checkpoint component Mad1 [Entophlyctis helioformis]|nr:spindle assembly checkpoint component Mad1 [Entophlyctis helioformis]
MSHPYRTPSAANGGSSGRSALRSAAASGRTPSALWASPASASASAPGSASRAAVSTQETAHQLLETFHTFMAVADLGTAVSAGSSAGMPAATPSQRRQMSPTSSARASPGPAGQTIHDEPASRSRSAHASARTAQLTGSMLEMRKQLKDLRRQLSDTRSTLESKIIGLERDKQRAETELENANVKSQSLDADRQFLFNRDVDQSAKIEQLQRDLLETKQSSEKRILELSTQNARLQESLSLATHDSENQRSELGASLDQYAADNSMLADQLNDTRAQLAEQTRQLSESQIQVTNLKAALDQLRAAHRVQSAMSSNEDKENMGILHKQLADQGTHIQALERRIAHLNDQASFYRTIQENTERLKEEKAALEHKVELLDSTRRQLSETQVRLASLEAERSRWQSFLGDMGTGLGVDSPYALAKLLSAQRLEIASLKQQIGMLGADAAQSYASSLEQEMDELRDQIRSLKSAQYDSMRNLNRAESLYAVAQKEVANLRDQLKSYDTEEQSMMGSYDSQKSKRIADLEVLVEEYKARIHALDAEIRANNSGHTASIAVAQQQQQQQQQGSGQGHAGATSLTAALQEMDVLRRENDLLKQDNKSLEGQVAVLQHALGRGEFDPTTTRVLMLADNPESRAAKERSTLHKALADENRQLRAQLERVESTAAMAAGRTDVAVDGRDGAKESTVASARADVIPVESLRAKELECDMMKQELDGRDKRILRLKEVYAAKVKEFREAVYTLLGFKIDVQMDGQVRLASAYGHASHDPVFVFSTAISDQVSLELSGGSSESRARVYEAMKMYVERHGSIPALMSAMTLDWFERSLR